jgi:quercetin dioxygenase-like cupin family protein
MTDIETIREKWRIEGFDCTLWEDPPDKVWSDLADPRDERVLVLSGVLQVESEGQEPVVLRAGDEVFIPANVRHGSRVLSTEPVQLLFGYRVEEKNADSGTETRV